MKKIIIILILLVFLTACNSLTQQGKRYRNTAGFRNNIFRISTKRRDKTK